VGTTALAFSAEGALLASGGYDNLAKVWDTSSGRLQVNLIGHTAAVLALAFSPDQRTMATAGLDRTIRIWSLGTGRELLRLPQDGMVFRLEFSGDGRYLAAACLNLPDLRVYDAGRWTGSHPGQQGGRE
jgi:WD40 repeat protein